MPEKCKDCCSRLFCMSVAEVNGEDFETMANKKDCRKRVFTNADRIRAMSDEELADFIAPETPGNRAWCDPVGEVRCGKAPCRKCVRMWLQQPAEEG